MMAGKERNMKEGQLMANGAHCAVYNTCKNPKSGQLFKSATGLEFTMRISKPKF
jgi:hypothetical protein